MKPKRKKIIFIIGGFILVVIGYNAIDASFGWIVPDSLVGNWKGKDIVKVRYHIDSKYIFQPSPDSVQLTLTISKDGSITGSLGGADFLETSIYKNRGCLARQLNLATDFSIRGKLIGPVFDNDSLLDKTVVIPIDLKNNVLSGDLFQKDGWDIYPMTGLNLKRN